MLAHSAHTNQIYNVISGLVKAGVHVKLCAPRFKYNEFSLKNAPDRFDIPGSYLKIILWPFRVDERIPKSFFVTIQFVFFLVILFKNKLVNRDVIVYSRSFIGTFLSKYLFGFDVIIHELHSYPVKRYQHKILHGLKIICNSPQLKNKIIPIVDSPNVLSVHNPAVPVLSNITKGKVRRALGLQNDIRYIIYTGKIFIGKSEIDNYLELARILGKQYQVVLVGGKKSVVEHYRKVAKSLGITNLRLTGKLPRRDVIKWQFAADGLLMYYDSSVQTLEYCSPVKLFEYMMTGNPIYGTKSKSIEGVVLDNAYLIEPDDISMLADVIHTTICSSEAYDKARSARELVGQFSSYNRALRVREFIEGNG